MKEIHGCRICKKEYQLCRISTHLHCKHNVNLKNYYDTYFKKDGEGLCLVCGKETRFKSFKEGYFKYHVECVAKDKSVQQKKKDNFKAKTTEEQEKIKREARKKLRKTCKEKYGKEEYFSTDDFNSKRENTSLKKYGAKIPSSSEVVQNKCKNTMFKKYGSHNAMLVPQFKKKCFDTFRKKFVKDALKFLDAINLDLISEYENNQNEIKIKCRKCGYVYNKTYANIQQGPHPCNNCYPTKIGKSEQEEEILQYIKEIIPNKQVENNNRTVLKPKELDIYIPEKNIAFEYNGLYFHSEEFNIDKNYHLNKTNECENKKVKLIHIFEDEWFYKKDIVKSRISQILGVSKAKKIYARNCTIKEIDTKLKNEFLEKFHLQGKDISKVRLGAFYDDKLISVMTFSHGNISKGSKKIKDVWELNRFCSNCEYMVVGIASKLLEHFKRNYKWKEIFSYADRRWSDGNLYYKLGFKLDHITDPNYWYVKGFKRIHRFNLRKRPDEPKDIPEWILRHNEGYLKIWDCGNLKFNLKNF